MTIENAPLADQVSLLSGNSFWGVPGLPEHGVEPVVLTDGPHGVRYQAGTGDHLGINDSAPATCFPPAVAVGSSWDPTVAERIGEAIAREARALGVTVVLGPGVNIKRSPLCGRNFEYYAEDPLLSGVLGTAHVQGMQRIGVGASVKHFAANNQETDRMSVSAEVDERTLREIYLPAFERVVTQARPATVMCSYNKVNGVPASQNRWLLTEVLRDQWGFEGVVVSDWGAVGDRVAALEAGLDLEMPGNGGVSNAQVVEAVTTGRVPQELVTTSARRVAELSTLVAPATGDLDVEGGHALARTLAAETVVLLRNQEQTLPLRAGQRVAVVGAFAETLRYQGGGSSHINPTRVEAPLDALRAAGETAGLTVDFARGFPQGPGQDDADALRHEAVTLAGGADVAVVFAGLGEAEESEGFDRESLSLPTAQVEVIRAVAAAAPRTVVVLSHGGLVTLEEWHDDVDAILDTWLLGQAGGGAIADVLLGHANPSGRLAETIPLRLEDTPAFLNFPGEQGVVRYGEGVMVGYRHYVTVGRQVRYPFGHGLSYTEFRERDLRVEVTGTDTATVRVTVENVGAVAGKHVVQVYVATDAGPVRRPARELRAFTKVALAPGESREVELALDARAFAYWDVTAGDWVTAPGTYTVQVCADAHTPLLEQDVRLEGQVVAGELTMRSSVKEWLGHPVVGPVLMEGMTAGMTDEQRAMAEANADALRMVESMPFQQFLDFTQVPIDAATLDQLMALSRTS